MRLEGMSQPENSLTGNGPTRYAGPEGIIKNEHSKLDMGRAGRDCELLRVRLKRKARPRRAACSAALRRWRSHKTLWRVVRRPGRLRLSAVLRHGAKRNPHRPRP